MAQETAPTDAPDRVIYLYGNRVETMCGHCGESTTARPCPDHQRTAYRG